MSGEWGGYPSLPLLPRSPIMNKNKNSDEVAKAAGAALKRLNSLIKESTDWRMERSELESKVMRLSAALRSLSGKSPDEIARPDPVTIHQREEILRLKTAGVRLEDEVRRLRISLLESDQAITCSGAKILKEKLRKSRNEEARRRLELSEQVIGLKARLREAESESSCASLNRLRKKLREILRNDKKMDRVIADAANNGCNAVSRLTKEFERVGAALGREETENSQLRAENESLKAALDEAEGDKRVREAEEKASGLVKRIAELEGALNDNRTEFEEREVRLTSVKNELIGAKISFKVKADQVEELRGAEKELEDLQERSKARERCVDDLRRRLEAASSIANDVERLRAEINRVRPRVIDLEIERDGLVEEVEKMGSIVSERNEQIVRILSGNDVREEEGKAEIEELKDRLGRSLAENKELRSRCENLEDDLIQLGGKIGKACSAGDSEPKDIDEGSNSDFLELNGALKARVDDLQGSKLELENELVALKGRVKALGLELETEKSGRTELEEKAKSIRRENELLKYEAQKLVAGFVQRLEKLTTGKNGLEDQVQELKTKNLRLASTSEKELERLRTERDALKTELENLTTVDELRTRSRASKSTETGKDEFDEELIRVKEEAERTLRDASSLTAENKELRETVAREKRLRKDIGIIETAKKIGEGVDSRKTSHRVDKESEVMEYGDYVLADRELKYYIHLQSLAVKRILDFIRYVEDENRVKPAMATFLEPTLTNAKVLNLDENMTTTFRMSQKLSERIFEAEVDVQKLERLRNEREHLRKKHDNLEKRVKILIEDKMLDTIDTRNGSAGFLLQVEEEDSDEKVVEINRRISALQDQIKSKQYEAGRKLIEMRETMQEERIRLMGIADG